MHRLPRRISLYADTVVTAPALCNDAELKLSTLLRLLRLPRLLRLALPDASVPAGGAGKSARSRELNELNPSMESVLELQLMSSEFQLDDTEELDFRDTMDPHLELELCDESNTSPPTGGALAPNVLTDSEDAEDETASMYAAASTPPSVDMDDNEPTSATVSAAPAVAMETTSPTGSAAPSVDMDDRDDISSPFSVERDGRLTFSEGMPKSDTLVLLS